MSFSVVITGNTSSELLTHLLRKDGQEDLCFMTWQPSTGQSRTTAILVRPILPRTGERNVHGNASFEPDYLLRAAQTAGQAKKGLAFAHSHPLGRGWQGLNEIDRRAEARIANVARELTGFPLVGLTVAGDGSWGARVWQGVGQSAAPVPCESVRVVGQGLSVTFDPQVAPPPRPTGMQLRTVHTWGEETQALVARLRIAVAGVGSVGMSIAETLARTGVRRIGVFDFDTVEWVNLDRLRGATALDAVLKRGKVDVAQRLLAEGSTASAPQHEFLDLSICEPDGLRRLLDFDLIFSCVDRPWPRHVLNTIAYADLIPVVEGGLSAFRNADGGLRNAYWRSTVVGPGRPCLACLNQYDVSLVQVERDGSLDDPSYIANLPAGSSARRRENVASLSLSVAAALLQQFLSHVAQPSGFGDPGPLRYDLRSHHVERDEAGCVDGCSYRMSVGVGDARLGPAGRHVSAERARRGRATVGPIVRVGRWIDDRLAAGRATLRTIVEGISSSA